MFSDKTFRFTTLAPSQLLNFTNGYYWYLFSANARAKWLMKIYPILKTKQKWHTVVNTAVVRHSTRVIKYSAKCQALLLHAVINSTSQTSWTRFRNRIFGEKNALKRRFSHELNLNSTQVLVTKNVWPPVEIVSLPTDLSATSYGIWEKKNNNILFGWLILTLNLCRHDFLSRTVGFRLLYCIYLNLSYVC